MNKPGFNGTGVKAPVPVDVSKELNDKSSVVERKPLQTTPIRPPERTPKSILTQVETDMNWFTPVVSTELCPNMRKALDMLRRIYPQLSEETFFFCWTQLTRLEPASRRLEQFAELANLYIKRKADQAHLLLKVYADYIDICKTRVKEIEKDLPEKRKTFVTAMATAQLPIAKDMPISAVGVSAAIKSAVPDTTVLAGKVHIPPPPDHDNLPLAHQVGSLIFHTVVPVICGLFLAFCLVEVIQIVSMNDIIHGGNTLEWITGLTAFGTSIVSSIGKVCSSAAFALRRVVRIRKADADPDDQVPEVNERWIVVSMTCLMGMLWAGETTLEAIGLQFANLHHILLQSDSGHPGSPLPFATCLVGASVFSGSYLAAKLWHAWNCENDRASLAWLNALQDEWHCAICMEPTTVAAFTAAADVEFDEAELEALKTSISETTDKATAVENTIALTPEMQAEFDVLTATVIGEKDFLDTMLGELLADAKAGNSKNNDNQPCEPFFEDMTAMPVLPRVEEAKHDSTAG